MTGIPQVCASRAARSIESTRRSASSSICLVSGVTMRMRIRISLATLSSPAERLRVPVLAERSCRSTVQRPSAQPEQARRQTQPPTQASLRGVVCSSPGMSLARAFRSDCSGSVDPRFGPIDDHTRRGAGRRLRRNALAVLPKQTISAVRGVRSTSEGGLRQSRGSL